MDIAGIEILPDLYVVRVSYKIDWTFTILDSCPGHNHDAKKVCIARFANLLRSGWPFTPINDVAEETVIYNLFFRSKSDGLTTLSRKS